MPEVFSTIDAEYTAATTLTAVFDISATGRLTLTGPDAPQFLHNLCTNDVKSLPLGGGCEAYLCDPRAKVLHVLTVAHIKMQGGQHGLWLETTPGRATDLYKALDRYLISEQVEIKNVTDDFAEMHLAGPTATQTLADATGAKVPELAEFQMMERTIKGVTVLVRKRDVLNLTGYDIVVAKDSAGKVWGGLTASGATPAGTNTYETLRVEAASPIYGIDIDATRFVMEVARAERAVSFTKGCFPGQEPIVMARDRAGFINRAFMGVKIGSPEAVPAGGKLYSEANEVGSITSSVYSPRLGAVLGIGYIKRGFQDKGKTLEWKMNEVCYPAEVLGFPPLG